MPRKKSTQPKLRRRKSRNLGVVTLDGHDYYLGHWPAEMENPPPEVDAAYHRKIAEWKEAAVPANPAAQTAALAPSVAPSATPVSPAPAAPGPVRRAVPPAPAAAGQPAVPGILVEDLLARFWTHAEQYYRRPDGSNTNELTEYRCSLRPLRHLFSNLAAGAFTTRHLKTVRELMVKGYEHPKYGAQKALARNLINNRVRRIVRVWKWAVSEGLVEVSVWQALTTLASLKKGRSAARETEPVRPVSLATVDATVAQLHLWLAAAVRVQQFTGARAGEILVMRGSDLVMRGSDREGRPPVWLYEPSTHKGSWRGKSRVIPIGPRTREALLPLLRVRCPLCGTMDRAGRIGWCSTAWLCGPCADRMDEQGIEGPWRPGKLTAEENNYFVFSPREAMEDRAKVLRSTRKTSVQPSQQNRRKKGRKRAPRERYTVRAYDRAIERAAERAKVEHWSSHQLRHLAGTETRRQYGAEAAQQRLGHQNLRVTEIYAEKDLNVAIRLAAEIG
jgi:integrase